MYIKIYFLRIIFVCLLTYICMCMCLLLFLCISVYCIIVYVSNVLHVPKCMNYNGAIGGLVIIGTRTHSFIVFLVHYTHTHTTHTHTDIYIYYIYIYIYIYMYICIYIYIYICITKKALVIVQLIEL